MTKHSTRLKSAPQATPVKLPSDDENPGGKKRKTYDSKGPKVDGRPQAKRVRGKRGLLKQLVEMPVDILFEVP